jgi:hypothetical protein
MEVGEWSRTAQSKKKDVPSAESSRTVRGLGKVDSSIKAKKKKHSGRISGVVMNNAHVFILLSYPKDLNKKHHELNMFPRFVKLRSILNRKWKAMQVSKNTIILLYHICTYCHIE